LCNVKHHGNAKASSTLYVSTLETKDQYKKTESISKSHSVFFKKPFISKHYIFLFFIRFQWFKMLWVHQINSYINNLDSSGTRRIETEKVLP
jgi:hypothetical protein